MEKIKYVCSLGYMCQTAQILKRAKLKVCSYPFDWVFSDCDVVLDCLEDDFKKFLDRAKYTDPVHKYHDNQCGHSDYHEDFFFHKNPKEDHDHQYYERCVWRFKDLLKQDDKKLFLIVIVPDATQHPKNVFDELKSDPEIAVRKTHERLSHFNLNLKKYTKNYSLAAFFNLVSGENKYSLSSEDGLDFFELHTASKSNGLNFFYKKDNAYLHDIINKHYEFDLINKPHART
jgi:hypothetical protein